MWSRHAGGTSRFPQTPCAGPGLWAGQTAALLGREGFGPSTLGLRVRPNELQRGTTNGNSLQVAHFQAATSCDQMRPGETSPYAHSYARLLLTGATCAPACSSRPPVRKAPFRAIPQAQIELSCCLKLTGMYRLGSRSALAVTVFGALILGAVVARISSPASARPVVRIPAGVACGTYRWNVKTLSDALARLVNFHPRKTTVSALGRLAPTGSFTRGQALSAGRTESALGSLRRSLR
jgi:hypothetical protein